MAHLQQPLPPTPTISSRPSKRAPVPLLLSSFPAPPSHIPPTPPQSTSNPPPTGPPTDPLPPLPSGPSRISEHDQLLILSSVRSRRSSNYSQRDRDSIVSSRSPSSLGRSVSRSSSLTTPTTPSPFQHSRMLMPLSDISDSDSEAAKTTTSPVLLHNSPRRLRPSHQPDDSISSIDMRDVLGVYADDIHNTHQRPTSTRHIPLNSFADPEVLLSALDLDHIPPATKRASCSPSLSPSRRSNYPLHSPHRSLSGSYRPTHARSSSTVTAVPCPQSQTQTPIQSHKHSLSDVSGIVVTKTTTTTTSTTINSDGHSQGRGRGSDDMTLDELSSNKQNYQDANTSTQPPQSPRVPSPDIATILSVMPLPALSLSRSHDERGGDSDPSLDLHTPLPHLMLRHGLLSPNSKLLPQADCSRAVTPLDERPGSIVSVLSNSSVVTKSGLIKDERDTVTRRVRHRDGKLLRGGIGLTTGLGWSDSEDEDAPSPLTRRLSSLNLSRRSSASSIYSATSPPLSCSSSLRRIHPLSRSYSSGAILETEREDDEPRSFDDYSSYPYDYDEDEEEEEEDHTLEESGHWAQRYRLGQTSPPVSWQRHRQPPPSARSRNRKNQQIQSTARTSTGSVGSGFSLEVTIPEGSTVERSKTPSRLRRPSSHTSIKSSSIGVGGGGRDSSGSSSLDSRFSGFSSICQQDCNNGNYDGGSGNGNTPSSASSTLSIPMPSTPKDIFNPNAPPLLSSKRGMSLMNKEKSLPPLPAGGLKKKSSGNLQRSIISNGKSRTAATTTANPLNGTGKYAFPSSRIRTFSSASTASTSTPSPSSPDPAAAAILSPSSSAVTIKPNVRPLQLPRQTTRAGGDRPAVPVPSPTLNPLPLPQAAAAITPPNSLRAPTPSLSTLPSRHRPSPITPILLGHVGTASAPASPAVNGGGVAVTTTATGSMVRAKPRTGTGMVYRTSSYGAAGLKMRAPMILGGSSNPLVASGGGSGSGGSGSIGGSSNGFSEAIAL